MNTVKFTYSMPLAKGDRRRRIKLHVEATGPRPKENPRLTQWRSKGLVEINITDNDGNAFEPTEIGWLDIEQKASQMLFDTVP